MKWLGLCASYSCIAETKMPSITEGKNYLFRLMASEGSLKNMASYAKLLSGRNEAKSVLHFMAQGNTELRTKYKLQRQPPRT